MIEVSRCGGNGDKGGDEKENVTTEPPVLVGPWDGGMDSNEKTR